MRFVWTLLLAAIASTALAQSDAQYNAEIRKHTTDARFLTELVDHLPPSDTVPSPLEFHGYIAANEDFIPNYGDRHHYGEVISTKRL